MFPAFAKAAGIDASKVNWVVAAATRCPDCSPAGKVPCVGQFTVGEPLLRAQARAGQAGALRLLGSGPELLRQRHRGDRQHDRHQARSGAPLRRRHDPRHERCVRRSRRRPGQIMHKLSSASGRRRSPRARPKRWPNWRRSRVKPLGEIDPARIEATIDVVKGAFKLKTPVTANDVYAPGFVSK